MFFQPSQRDSGHEKPAGKGPLGQVASRLDDGLGARPQTQGQARLPPGAREGQELRLGRVEKAIPEAQQQQEVESHRPLPQVGRGRRRLPDQGRLRRWNPEEQVSLIASRDERGRRQVRPRRRND